MRIYDIINLSFAPHNQRKYIYPAAALFMMTIIVITFSGISGMRGDSKNELRALAERYDRVVVLAGELSTLQKRGGSSLRPMEPLAAVQQISRDLKLETNLASVRPMNLMGEKEGVQVFFESINLDQLIGLLTSMESRAGLQVSSFNISRRMDKRDLADLQMVLTR